MLNYSKEEHDKCKKVADAFQELYDMQGDSCVLDAGKFGFVYLQYYIENNESFDANDVYRNSTDLFNALWNEWLYLKIITPLFGTDLTDLPIEELYDKLPEDTKKEYEQKRIEFLKKAELLL